MEGRTEGFVRVERKVTSSVSLFFPFLLSTSAQPNPIEICDGKKKKKKKSACKHGPFFFSLSFSLFFIMTTMARHQWVRRWTTGRSNSNHFLFLSLVNGLISFFSFSLWSLCWLNRCESVEKRGALSPSCVRVRRRLRVILHYTNFSSSFPPDVDNDGDDDLCRL